MIFQISSVGQPSVLIPSLVRIATTSLKILLVKAFTIVQNIFTISFVFYFALILSREDMLCVFFECNKKTIYIFNFRFS